MSFEASNPRTVMKKLHLRHNFPFIMFLHRSLLYDRRKKKSYITGLHKDSHACLEYSIVAANLFSLSGGIVICGQRNKYFCLFLHLVYVILH